MSSKSVRIGVDLMGGKNSFDATVPAVKQFAQSNPDIEVVAYGVSEALIQLRLGNVECVETQNDIVDEKEKGGDENPLRLIVKGKKSAIVQGINAVHQSETDAFLSRGNTGALVSYAKRQLGVEGSFAALSCWIPRTDLSDIHSIPSDILLMDVGAEFDTNVLKIINNVRLGVKYLQTFKGIVRPKVALLNAGSEAYKGDEAYRNAHKQLQESEFSDDFLGNLEPNHLLSDVNPDVVVAGGMVGNIVLKGIEGTFSTTTDLIKEHAFGSRLKRLVGLYQGYKIKKGLGRFNPNNRPDGRLHGLRDGATVVKVHGDGKPKAVLNGLSRTLEDLRTQKKEEA